MMGLWCQVGVCKWHTWGEVVRVWYGEARLASLGVQEW